MKYFIAFSFSLLSQWKESKNKNKNFLKKNLNLAPQTWSFSVVKVVPGPGTSFRTARAHNF